MTDRHTHRHIHADENNTCQKKGFGPGNYRRMKFCNVELINIVVRTEVVVEHYERNIHLHESEYDFYLNMNCIKTGNRIFT